MVQAPHSGTVVTVAAQVERLIEPELATVRLAVAFDGHQRSAVLERCTQIAAKVHSSLEGLNTDERAPLESWHSSQMSVWSDRPWSADGARLPIVYHARVEYSATFSHAGELSIWLAATSARDGVAIAGIEWRLSEAHQREAEADAHIEAVSQARNKAQDYAAALGLTLGGALEIADAGLLTGGVAAQESPRGFLRAKTLADAGPTFQPEPVVIQASVHARFSAS